MQPVKLSPGFSVAIILLVTIASHSVAQSEQEAEHSPEDQRRINRIVIDAFQKTHDGWSSDEVILQDKLNEAFVAKCEEGSNEIESSRLNWTLINLRKAGKLKSKTTKRKRTDLSQVRHIAEIVTRSMIDKHKCSIDRLICDSDLRKEFDELATSFDASVDNYSVRKAAFQLRKTRRLRPELIGRIADWGRTITTYQTEEILESPTIVGTQPGIYIFRDATGYLYIGQTDNLRERLVKHLDESHNASLAAYLNLNSTESITIEVHAFDRDSQASKTRVRRAYESELIASRKPRFNLQP